MYGVIYSTEHSATRHAVPVNEMITCNKTVIHFKISARFVEFELAPILGEALVQMILRKITVHHSMSSLIGHVICFLKFFCITPVVEQSYLFLNRCFSSMDIDNFSFKSPFKNSTTWNLRWLKYCRYGVKLYPINQSRTSSESLIMIIQWYLSTMQ